jgi:hypothetical protein
LKSILNLMQTTQYKISNAAAWMLNHVSTLIFDFKFITIIIILNLHAHKICKNHIFPIFISFKILGCYSFHLKSSFCSAVILRDNFKFLSCILEELCYWNWTFEGFNSSSKRKSLRTAHWSRCTGTCS